MLLREAGRAPCWEGRGTLRRPSCAGGAAGSGREWRPGGTGAEERGKPSAKAPLAFGAGQRYRSIAPCSGSGRGVEPLSPHPHQAAPTFGTFGDICQQKCLSRPPAAPTHVFLAVAAKLRWFNWHCRWRSLRGEALALRARRRFRPDPAASTGRTRRSREDLFWQGSDVQ